MSNVTPEDLILYLYGETDGPATIQIEQALASSWALREKLSVLQMSMKRLNDGQSYSPSRATLDTLMAYARDQAKITH
jgi:hypothetical protein